MAVTSSTLDLDLRVWSDTSQRKAAFHYAKANLYGRPGQRPVYGVCYTVLGSVDMNRVRTVTEDR